MGLGLLLGSLYLSPGTHLPHAITELTIDVLPAVGMVFSIRRLAHRRVPTVIAVTLFLYSFAVILSTFVNPITHLGALKLLSPAAAAVAWGLGGALLTYREFLSVGRWFMGVAAVQAVLGIAEVQLHSATAMRLAADPDTGVYFPRDNLVLPGFLRAAGTTGHPIILGVLCATGLLLTVLPTGLRVERRWIRNLLAALFAWGLLLSGSRTSLAALGFAFVIYFLHRHTPISRTLRNWLVLAVAPLVYGYLKGAAHDAETVSPFSLTNRQAAGGRIVDALGRQGPTFYFGEASNFTLPTVADNQFLTTLGMYGLFGLLVVLFAGVLAIAARSPMVAALSTFSVAMFMSFDTLGFSLTTVVFWLLVGASRIPAPTREAVPADDQAPVAATAA